MNSSLILGAVVAFLVVLLLSRVKSSPPTPASPEERARLEHQLQLHLAAGRKIQAIKLYRSLHGTDLEASKAAIESLLLGGSLQ